MFYIYIFYNEKVPQKSPGDNNYFDLFLNISPFVHSFNIYFKDRVTKTTAIEVKKTPCINDWC